MGQAKSSGLLAVAAMLALVFETAEASEAREEKSDCDDCVIVLREDAGHPGGK